MTLMTAPIGLTLYNPDVLSKADLIAGFVARQPLLQELIDDLRRTTPATSPQHQLLFGQRGLGKTTLLRRLAFAIADDPALGSVWQPLVFPEEQYNVADLGDFWLNCVDALGDALDESGREGLAEQLDTRVASLGPKPTADAALALLLDESDRLERRLLLLVDNLDLVVDRIGRDQEWTFRRLLSEERRLTLIGASSRALEAFYEHGRAFYDFFRIHELKGLTDDETFDLLRSISERAGARAVCAVLEDQPARIRTLRLLTGGNPRTITLLFRILQEGAASDIGRDLEQLLDIYTPLYKAQFEELPAQAQKVVDAMALHWDPLTAGDVAAATGFATNLASAQLNRLEDLGVVEKVAWFGEKKAAYQLAERFFNIWYLMRASRRVRRKLIWLVKFLESWFSEEELRGRAEAHLLSDVAEVGAERYAEWSFAYAQVVKERLLRSSLEHAGLRAALTDDKVREHIDLSDLPPALNDKKQRMEAMRNLAGGVPQARQDWGDIDPKEFWRLLGGSPFYDLAEKRRVVERLGELSPEQLRELHDQLSSDEASILAVQGVSLNPVVKLLYHALAAGEIADPYDWSSAAAIGGAPLACLALDLVASHHIGRSTPESIDRAEAALRDMTEEAALSSRAWAALGGLLHHHRGEREEAEVCYRRSLAADPRSADVWIELGGLVAANKDRRDEAAEMFRHSVEVDPRLATAWAHLGGVLVLNVRRTAEAEAALKQAVLLDSTLVEAWVDLGFLMQQMGRLDEAESAYRNAIGIDPNDGDVWSWLAEVLARRGDRTRSESAHRQAVAVDPENPHAWSSMGDFLSSAKGGSQEAEEAYRQALKVDPSDGIAWSDLGKLLYRQKGRREEAAAAYHHAVEVEPTSEYAWCALGDFLARYSRRRNEAEAAYRHAVDVQPLSGFAWGRLADFLEGQHRTVDAGEALVRSLEVDPQPWRETRLLDILQDLGRSPEHRPRAIEIAGRALAAVPANYEGLCVLAEILTRDGQWARAREVFDGLLAKTEAGPSAGMTDACAAAVTTGHTQELLDLFRQTGADDRWRPLYEALRAVDAGSVDYLRRVAPEVRTVAESLYERLTN
jgi:tetratricopeptide (TPR) repeat protein